MDNEANNAVVRDLALASMVKKEILQTPDGKDVPLAFVHNSLKRLDLEQFMDRPLRLQRHLNLSSVESFIEYIVEFDSDTFIQGFQDKEAGELFNAILDAHKPDIPSWEDHAISLKVATSPEWKIWTKRDGDRFTQRRFSEFIEDNVADLVEDSAGILAAIKNTTVTERGRSTNKVEADGDTSDSSKSLLIENPVPPIDLALRPWLGMKNPMAIKARVFSSITENGKVEFFYNLINAEAAIEQKFNEYRKQIEDDTGVTVFV